MKKFYFLHNKFSIFQTFTKKATKIGTKTQILLTKIVHVKFEF